MRATQYLISTLRENPQDAVIASHRLMMRAGLIRKLGSGLYHLLPLGLRAFRKVERIIREEMNRSGALEFQLPILTPAELWEKSGRWDTMGKEMFRLKDRHEVWNVLGPTHEESFTDLVGSLVKSYRDLPLNVYQMHTKFRDEIRPRYGVMRSREFVMKDAYSFHRDQASLDETYRTMREAYRRIFSRTGLKTLPVEADSGSMGGSGSEEFMVPTEVGEETLLISENGSYRSNQEKTPVLYPDLLSKTPAPRAGKEVATPGKKTIEDVAEFLKKTPDQLLKVILCEADGKPVAVVLRGDRNLNDIKLKNHLGALEIEAASGNTVEKLGLVAGFIGPDDLKKVDPVLFDSSVLTRQEFITGAGKPDAHLEGYFPEIKGETVDLAQAVAGDPSPDGNGLLHEVKGIEVGHIFKLGEKYTKAFQLSVLDENGKASGVLMGCYGIGVNRTLAAVIEQDSTEGGIRWPISVAPFEAVLVGITKGEDQRNQVQDFYQKLLDRGLDLLWDDRDLRPGVRFADAELIGFPIRLTMGKGFFENGELELVLQGTGEKRILKGDEEGLLEAILEVKEDLYRKLRQSMEEHQKNTGDANNG